MVSRLIGDVNRDCVCLHGKEHRTGFFINFFGLQVIAVFINSVNGSKVHAGLGIAYRKLDVSGFQGHVVLINYRRILIKTVDLRVYNPLHSVNGSYGDTKISVTVQRNNIVFILFCEIQFFAFQFRNKTLDRKNGINMDQNGERRIIAVLCRVVHLYLRCRHNEEEDARVYDKVR